MFIREYKDSNVEYVAYYEVSGYNSEENQDDYIAKELTGWFQVINRYGKPDIHILTNKIRFGIHSEYKSDVEFDYVKDCLADIVGAKDNGLVIEEIACPNLYRDEKYYLVDADEFIDKEEAEEQWNNSFVGWEDADVNFPTTFRKFIKQASEEGILREVEFTK